MLLTLLHWERQYHIHFLSFGLVQCDFGLFILPLDVSFVF
jgi:hypothetical protein